MEFGRLPEAELTATKLKLPPEPAFNKLVLNGSRVANPVCLFGCAKWGRKEWVGKIYPRPTSEKRFLEHYVQQYNSIEMNATHYKIYDAATIAKWAAQVPGGFKFAPKVAKNISHFGKLTAKEFQTDKFLEGILAFGDKLGPIFLQMGDKFGPSREDELLSYLQTLPKDLQFFIELRHPEWYRNGKAEALFGRLKQLGIGTVITDTAGRRDCTHMYLTTKRAFIRFVGNSLHPTDFSRCDEWAKRINLWLSQGLEEVYFFMHMHDEATSPELSIYMAELLNKKCNLQIPLPYFV